MPRILLLVLILVFAQGRQDSGKQDQSPEQKPSEIVSRDPFTLKLKLPDGSSYEEHFDQVPYVKDGYIYIFPGEKFGVMVSTAGDEIAGLGYVKQSGKGDVRLEFKEEKAGGGRVMMILVIESKLKRTLYMDAPMQVPNRKGVYKTNVLPVLAGKIGFESWPHPISLLELKNLRFSQKPPNS